MRAFRKRLELAVACGSRFLWLVEWEASLRSDSESSLCFFLWHQRKKGIYNLNCKAALDTVVGYYELKVIAITLEEREKQSPCFKRRLLRPPTKNVGVLAMTFY